MRDEREIAWTVRKLSPVQREIYEFVRLRTIRSGVGPSLRATLAAFPGEGLPGVLRHLRDIKRLGLIGRGSRSTGPRAGSDMIECRETTTGPG
jgi:hypothetical protein